MCQDTGTAIVMGKRGERVLTGGDDERALSLGIHQTYETSALRFSQMAPLTMWDEQNTGTNLPAQIELYAAPGDAYKLLFMAKGGGSANKSYLYQETKAVLNRSSMLRFLDEKLRTLGTVRLPAVPPRRRDRRHVGRVRARRRPSTRRPTTSTRCRPPARRAATASATSSSSRTSSPSPRASASAPSSAASTSATTCASCGSPATARRARWPSRCRARPTARRSARSPPRACSSSSSRRTRRATCPRSPTTTWPTTTSCASTSTGRWTRSAPSSRATR